MKRRQAIYCIVVLSMLSSSLSTYVGMKINNANLNNIFTPKNYDIYKSYHIELQVSLNFSQKKNNNVTYSSSSDHSYDEYKIHVNDNVILLM